MNDPKLISILALYPDPRVMGGVVEYMETLRKYLPVNVVSQHFVVGGGPFIGGSGKPEEKYVKVVKTITSAFRLTVTLLFNRFDVVLINPSFNCKSILRDGLFIIVCKLCRIKTVYVQFHGWQNTTSDRIEVKPFQRWAFREIFGLADEIAVLSQEIRARLVRLGIDQDKVIVDKVFFDGAELSGPQVKPDGNVRFLFLSRFVQAKGIRNLVEAFIRLSTQRPDVMLILAGDGPEMEWVKGAIQRFACSDKILLPGYVTGKEKVNLLSQADVYVLPSDSEGCPISMLESMAAGCAVLITSVGSIPEIIVDGLNGIILGDNSAQTIFQSMSEMASNSETRKMMSDKNRVEAWSEFEAKINAKKFADRLEHLVSQ